MTWTVDQFDRAVSAYEGGHTVREIAGALEKSPGAVVKQLHKQSVPMRPRGVRPGDRIEILDPIMVAHGHTFGTVKLGGDSVTFTRDGDDPAKPGCILPADMVRVA